MKLVASFYGKKYGYPPVLVDVADRAHRLEREQVEARRADVGPVGHARDVGERAVVVVREAERARAERVLERGRLRAARRLEPHVHLVLGVEPQPAELDRREPVALPAHLDRRRPEPRRVGVLHAVLERDVHGVLAVRVGVRAREVRARELER